MKIQSITFPTIFSVTFEPAAREYIRERAYYHALNITPEQCENGEIDMENIKNDLRRIASSFESYLEAPEDAAIRIPATELEFLSYICQPPPEQSVLAEEEFKTNIPFRTWRFLSTMSGVSESLTAPMVPDSIVDNISEACHDRMSPELTALAAQSPTGAIRVNADGTITPHTADGPEDLVPLSDGAFGVIAERTDS